MGDVVHLRKPVQDVDDMLDSFKSTAPEMAASELKCALVIGIRKDDIIEYSSSGGISHSSAIGLLEILQFELLKDGEANDK